MTDKTRPYERRYRKVKPGCRSLDNQILDKTIKNLLKLRDATDPSLGEQSAKGKNVAAFDALQYADSLVKMLAGWAIDHVAGLAEEGLGLLQSLPPGTTQDPEVVTSGNTEDDHRYEISGSRWRRDPPDKWDPAMVRQLLFDILHYGPGLPRAFGALVTDAFEALDYGDVDPLLSPKRSSRKISLRVQKLQVQAIGFVYYRVGHKMRKEEAIKEVASAFSVSGATVKSWEKRLRDELGPSRMEVEKFRAEEAATLDRREKELVRQGAHVYLGLWGKPYSDEALQKVVARYRAAQRQRGAQRRPLRT